MTVIAILLAVGGRLVLRGEGLEGELFIRLFGGVFPQLIPPARSLSDAVFKVQKGAASLDRIEEVLKADLQVIEAASPAVFSFDEAIQFKDVQFSLFRIGRTGFEWGSTWRFRREKR